jgi:hypothetical protein
VPSEPPDLLLSVLGALLFVVTAVCLLLAAPATWTLVLALAAMVAGTMALALVIRLEIEQSERSQ